jgi:hypothetical protein
MKPTIPFILLIFIFAFTSQAQYIDVQAGMSMASGSFSNNNLSKPEDGFAKNGFSSTLGANYLFYKNLGVCARFNYASFAFNVKDFSDQTNSQSPQGTTQTVNTDSKYRSTAGLAGMYLTFGKKKLTADIRVLMGFLTLTSPVLTTTSTYSGQTYSQTLTSDKAMALAIGYGFTLRYKLPKSFCVTLNIDNINANTKFPKYSYQSSGAETVSKPFQANLIGLGIGYEIQ